MQGSDCDLSLLTASNSQDVIELKDLALQHSQHAGTDAWGRQKDQSVLISVRLVLRQTFESAAASDVLDGSTLHYGLLAKRIRAVKAAERWETLEDFAKRIEASLLGQAYKADLLDSCSIEVKLPKASLLGDCVIFCYNVKGHKSATYIYLRSVNVPVLVGVNANERARKQPLLFHLWVGPLQSGCSDRYAGLETRLVEVGSATHFIRDLADLGRLSSLPLTRHSNLWLCTL